MDIFIRSSGVFGDEMRLACHFPTKNEGIVGNFVLSFDC